MNGISIKNLTKNFGDNKALDNVNLQFEENKIYGLLGRNGAGKSTLLNIITNRLFADSGEVLVDGEASCENDNALKKIYLMSEKTYYPEKMKVYDSFKWSSEFYSDFDLEYCKVISDKFELNTKKTIKSLSTGYLSIFKAIIALSVNVPYVLFDEPVLGLDANHREMFYRLLLEKYSENPFTAVISTHLIDEVSTLFNDVVIIKKGQIIKNEEREKLLSKGYTVSGAASKIDNYISGKDVIGVDTLGGLKTAYIIGKLDRASLPEGIEASMLDLQKLFIQLTNS